jgi:hypothetical protein
MSPIHTLLFSVIAAFFISGCTTQTTTNRQIFGVRLDDAANQVSAKFQRSDITRRNAEQVISSCMPWLSGKLALSVSILSSATSSEPGWIDSSNRKGSYMVVSQGQVICVERLSDGRTFFPAEAFDQTIEPKGVAQSVKDNWLMQIARLYAVKGKAAVAYRLPEGKLLVVRYATEPTKPSNPNMFFQAGQLPYSYEVLTNTDAVDVDLTFEGEGLTHAEVFSYRGAYIKMPNDKRP